MADLGYTDAQAKQIPDAATKRAVMEIVKHVIKSPGIALGEPTHQTRATNLNATYLQSTTASDTGEFSIVHGLESAPQFAIPVIDLRQVGAQLVPLEVSRAADSRRVYLKSTSTRAAFTLLVG